MVKVRRRTTKGDVTRTILSIIKASGTLAAVLVAPNTLQAFDKAGILPHGRQREIIARARDLLIRNGSLKRDAKGFLTLTSKGKERLRSYERSEYTLLVPRVWDRRWRVLIFDVPEERRALRDKIRNTLVSIGFLRVQDSVWIFPHDCEEFIVLLKADFKIGKDLLYLIVDKIENDSEFRDWFNLK